MARNKFDVDETLQSPFNLNHIFRAIKYVKPHMKIMIVSLSLSIAATLLSLLDPIFIMWITDEFIPDGNIKGIVTVSIIFLFATLISIVLSTARSKIMFGVGQKIVNKMRLDLFTHLQKLPFTYYDNRPHGKILVRVVNYINSVSDFLSNGLVNIILELFSIVVLLIYMFFIDVNLTLIVLAGLPPLAIFVVSIRTAQRSSWQRQSNKMSNLNAYTHESIVGMRVTQAFAREEYNYNIFTTLLNDAKSLWMLCIRIMFSVFVVVENIAQWIYIIIHLVGVEWIQGGVKLGVLLAMARLAGRFWQPIQNMAALYNQLVNVMAYLERIFEAMDEPVTISDKDDAYELPPITGNVSFENVNFSYDENVKVLNDVSFDVTAGESIALVGATGSGKTTIINLLSRFYDIKEGNITLDGHSIKNITLNSLRMQMGVMLQDSFIFSGTIADNIRYGKLDATMEEIEAAAKIVKAHDFISQMSGGYETVLKERGSDLSGGQRQLISFARTLLSDPKILILDEATSSIDAQTEQILQEGLQGLLQNRTSFIVAHRLSTIRRCSRIMYIQKGEIMESGSHEDLMQEKGFYYKLYTSQLE